MVPRSVQNTNFFLQILVDGSPKRSWLTIGGKKQKNCSHLNHVAGRVCVPSNLDLCRLARDLLDGAHEDVRDDRDAQEAGEDISLSNLYILNYILYQGYMDAQKQTWSLSNI